MDQGALGQPLFLIFFYGSSQIWGEGVMGMDDYIGCVQLPGILQHGSAHRAAESPQGNQGEERQGHTEYKDERLFAGASDLSQYEPEMKHLDGFNPNNFKETLGNS